MKIKLKKLDEKAVVPSYAKPGDAGLDLTATTCTYDPDLDSFIYGTGLAIELPENHVGLIFPRSSIYKTPHMLANAVGVLDCKFRGEIKVIFKNHHIKQKTYNIGDRICQLIVMPYPTIEFEEVTELSDSERGQNGFGSSGV